MFLPASVFVHNPDTTEEAYNHLHHWLWLDDVGWRHCKCHVRAKSKGDAEVRFSSFRITFYPFFCPPKISTRDREVSIYSVRGLRGCPSRYESNGIKLRFGFCHQSSSTLSWLLPCKWGSQWRFFDQAACLTWDSVSPPRWMLLKALWRKGPRTVVRSLLI